jgi:hypothetical protein
MESDYSKTALLRFLDFIEEKGLLTKQNAQNWRVATGKILDDMSAAEASDVRNLDIDTAFRRFANRTAGKFSPNTLAEYRRRATLAIENFVQYASNPEAYKPLSQTGPKKTSATQIRPEAKLPASSAETRTAESVSATAGGLAMPFPLRSDFLAQIVIPRNLSTDEARRLSAFILTLATDFRPES